MLPEPEVRIDHAKMENNQNDNDLAIDSIKQQLKRGCVPATLAFFNGRTGKELWGIDLTNTGVAYAPDRHWSGFQS